MGDTQPRTFKLSPSALLSFPVSPLHIPNLYFDRQLVAPALQSSTERWESKIMFRNTAKAVVDVKLDDVLDRRHLPPLGLKDFEEWLLFVEQSAENLYFILWLKEYNARYTRWMNDARASLKTDHRVHPYQSTSHLPPSVKTNRSLAIFYSRAKQTFFTPNSPYELDLPSDILGHFHTPSPTDSLNDHHPNRNYSTSSGPLSPHPDPAVFREVEERVRSMLQESLVRFSNSTIANVGTTRATCGIVGGTVIALAGFLPPIAENFALSRNRWLRTTAFPGLWLGLTLILASLHGVCMMIYIFGDLRQLRSFELIRPSISPPQRLRPLRNNTPPGRPPLPEWSVPITRPPIVHKPIHDPQMTPHSPLSANAIHFLPPIHEPVSPSLLSPLSNNTGILVDNANRRVTMSSLCADSCISCDSDASRTSTTSSGEVEIHISEVFYDIEPPYLSDDVMTSSPVPSSWNGESPSVAPSAWLPHLTSRVAGSMLSVSYGSQNNPSQADVRASNARTSSTSDGGEWMPTAGFIRPFEYELEGWDSDSMLCTTEGSVGGYVGGDEESRIGGFARPTRLRRDGQRGVGTRGSIQFQAGSRRGSVTSGGSDQLGIFDFDALPAFQTSTTPATLPTFQRRPKYRACDASPPLPPLPHEASLTEAGLREGLLRRWLVETPKSFIRRAQGRCAAAKQVMVDVLGRSANEVLGENGGVEGGAYRDAPGELDEKQNPPAAGGVPQDREFIGPEMGTTLQPLPSPPHVVLAKEKGKVDGRQIRGSWRARWKQALSVPAFKSPLTKVLSPVVTRAQWEIVVRAGVIAFVISFVVVAVVVAVPVP